MLKIIKHGTIIITADNITFKDFEFEGDDCDLAPEDRARKIASVAIANLKADQLEVDMWNTNFCAEKLKEED
jgi:hypothetical protein